MHVDDAVSALLALIDRRGHWSLPEEAESVRENPRHSPELSRTAGDRGDRGEGVFNVATGNASALEAAASALTDRLDLVDVADGDGRGRSLVASPDRLKVTAGWKSLVPLAEGIERTVAWYSEGRDWWAPFTALIRAERQGPGFLVDRAFPI
jgi:nucleoside-diphosphate-sugar epimerase